MFCNLKLTYKTVDGRPKVKTVGDIIDVLRMNWDDIEHRETMKLILIDGGSKILDVITINVGTSFNCLVDFKTILQYVILSNCEQVVLAHNHTNDICTPSKRDIKLTKEIKILLSLLSVNLVDHIIITKNSFETITNYQKHGK